MPNWAMNELEVEAPNETLLHNFLAKMESAAKDDEVLSFQSILPMPEILEDTIAPFKNIEEVEKQIFRATGEHLTIQNFEQKYKNQHSDIHKIISEHKLGLVAFEETGFYDWYSWQYEKWGVKWGCQNSTIDVFEENKCLYNFDTPWGSPISWLLYVSYLYPEFKFIHKCADPSMNTHVEHYLENGNLQEMKQMEFFDAVEVGNWGGPDNWEMEEVE